MTCPCDTKVHPAPLAIPAGLVDLPRQIAGFPEWRTALLADLRNHPELDGWRARSAGDLGVMLLEMWAVVCDAISFYDRVHAEEAYLRTAKLETTVRGLVGVLGYVPRPAVAAEVELAVFLDGNRAVTLPAGTAFRSGAFDGEKPQVFELTADVTLHPWNGRFSLVPPRPAAAGDPGGPGTAPTSLHLLPKGATVRTGDVIIASDRARSVTSVEDVAGDDGAKYVLVTFSSALSLAADADLASFELVRATRTASLWTLPTATGSTATIDASLTLLVLDGLHRSLRVGDRVVLERSGERRWFAIDALSEVLQKVQTGTDSDGNTLYGWLPATRITLDVALNDASRTETATTWTSSDGSSITVHHGFQAAGTATAPATTVLADDDPLVVAEPVREAEGVEPPARFVLADADDAAAIVSGALDPATGALTLDGGEAGWDGDLTAPVELWGNVVTAVRGETVAREVLGSGDASVANQTFTLKKSPLTYLADASGTVSTLTVWVDGVAWDEAGSFYGAGPEDRVYVVRTDPDGVATVLFGDGVNGARLPTGASNVVASYRSGAGAAVPPAGSIAAIARPVKGLASVKQPVAATGGADAEDAENVRAFAPRSALVLGRAVSIPDMNALAAAVPGVRAVQTTWGWQGAQQRPVVQCWTAGTPSEGAVEERLRAMSDPTTPISADPALALPALLVVQVTTDERAVTDDVLAAVADALGAAETGFLQVERLGIGRTLYRSALTAAVLAVEGTVAVHFVAMVWVDKAGAVRWWLQDGYGASPGTGAFFDFSLGFWVNGEARSLG